MILLNFTMISLSTPKTFFCIWSGGCGWGQTFLVFNFLYNNMIYTFDIGVYNIHRYIYLCTTNFVWVLYFGDVGELPLQF